MAWTAVVIAAAALSTVALAAVFAVTAALAIVQVVRARREQPASVRVVLAAVLVVAAAASPVVVRIEAGGVAAVVLLAAVSLYDAAVFIVGTGARNHWEGPVAGAATLAPVALLVAAVAAPPFDGASPWVLLGSTAVLAPWGAPLATLLAGKDAHRVGALRRLDTLFLVGPAWMIAVAALRLG